MNNLTPNKLQLPKWTIYTLAVVSIVLILSAILQILTPKNTIQPSSMQTTNYDQTQTDFSNLTYQGDLPTLASTLPIAQVEIINYTDALISTLIKEFSLKQIDDYSIWVNDNWALNLDQGNGRYILSAQQVSLILEKNIYKENALKIAQEFLSTYFADYEVINLEQETQYFKSLEGEPITSEGGNAPVVKLSFGYKFNDYPVLYQNNTDNFISIYVDSTSQIRKVDFKTQGITLRELESKVVLSPQEALWVATQTDRAAIIHTGYQTPVELDFSQIISGSFNSVELEYRVDTEQSLAYPFYRFAGTVTDKDDQNFEAEIITPAIEITTGN